jgi:DNA-binding transcriptional MerR regulator
MADLIGIGAVARETGTAKSTLRFWEDRGSIPKASRLEPGARLVWRADDLPVLRERVAALRKASERRPETGAA